MKKRDNNKVICKKDRHLALLNKGILNYVKDREYHIMSYSRTYVYNSVDVEYEYRISGEKGWSYFDVVEFSKYFYSDIELRKRKLEEIGI